MSGTKNAETTAITRNIDSARLESLAARVQAADPGARQDIERLLPVGVPDGMNPKTHARIATRALRLVKRLPGVK